MGTDLFYCTGLDAKADDKLNTNKSVPIFQNGGNYWLGGGKWLGFGGSAQVSPDKGALASSNRRQGLPLFMGIKKPPSCGG